jgi:hypothetical protein
MEPHPLNGMGLPELRAVAGSVCLEGGDVWSLSLIINLQLCFGEAVVWIQLPAGSFRAWRAFIGLMEET